MKPASVTRVSMTPHADKPSHTKPQKLTHLLSVPLYPVQQPLHQDAPAVLEVDKLHVAVRLRCARIRPAIEEAQEVIRRVPRNSRQDAEGEGDGGRGRRYGLRTELCVASPSMYALAQ